jgi:hypothetical protein
MCGGDSPSDPTGGTLGDIAQDDDPSITQVEADVQVSFAVATQTQQSLTSDQAFQDEMESQYETALFASKALEDTGKHQETIESQDTVPYYAGEDALGQQQKATAAVLQGATQGKFIGTDNPLAEAEPMTSAELAEQGDQPISNFGLGQYAVGTLATHPETTAKQTAQQQAALAQALTSGEVDINDPIGSQSPAAIEASNTLGQMNPTLSMGISVVGGLISMAAGVPIGPGVAQTVLQGQPGAVGASLTSALGFTPFGDQIAGITPPALLGMTDQSGDQDASVADPTEGIGPDMPTLAAPIGMTMQTPTTPTDFPPPLTFDEPVDPRPAALPVLLEPGTSISDLSADNILAEIQSNQITAERRRRAGAAASIRTSPSGAQVTSADVFRPSLFRVTQTLG